MKNFFLFFIVNLFFLLSFIIPNSFAQIKAKEANWWYFGQNAGINFSGNSVNVQTNGKLSSFAAASVATDSNGNLLFYTDGNTVWDKNHNQMLSETDLQGNKNASQGALIIKQPNTENIYYIYTQDATENNLANGLRLHIVDMTLNKGLGVITQKNLLILSNICEKMTAIKQTNGQDLWLLNATFGQGIINTIPVGTGIFIGTSQQTIVDTLHQGNINTAKGAIKVSPDGKWLAMSYQTPNLRYALSLYSFDNEFGKPTFISGLAANGLAAYGIEFSPDNSKLYFTTNSINVGGKANVARIHQVNLTKEPFKSIEIAKDSVNFAGSLQLAPDGNIYCAIDNSNFLGTIKNPNGNETLAQWAKNGLNLQGKKSTRSLPNFPQNFFEAPFQADFKIQAELCP